MCWSKISNIFTLNYVINIAQSECKKCNNSNDMDIILDSAMDIILRITHKRKVVFSHCNEHNDRICHFNVKYLE